MGLGPPLTSPTPLDWIDMCVVYNPPASPHDLLLIEHISSTPDILLTKYPGAGTVVSGNFNRLDTDILCRLSGLVQVVNIPTRCQATLDKIFTNIQQHYQEPQLSSPLGLSDHKTVIWRPLIWEHEQLN